MRRWMMLKLVIGAMLGASACVAPVEGLETDDVVEATAPYESGRDWVVIERPDEELDELATEALVMTTFVDEDERRVERAVEIAGVERSEGSLRVQLAEPFTPGALYHLVERHDDGRERLVDSLFAAESPDQAEASPDAFTLATAVLYPIEEMALPPPPPPPPPGQLEVAERVPADFARDVPRDLDMIRLRFTSAERIDCARTGTSAQAGRLVSEVAGVQNHSFFHGPDQAQASIYHRGTLECDAARNELRFRIPQTGDLYGNGWYRFRSTVWSTVGSRRTFEIMFRTENPGLRVQLVQVQNRKEHCGGIPLFRDKCDVYLVGNVAIDGDEVSTVKLPDPNGTRTFANANRDQIFTVDSPTIIESSRNVGRAVRLSIVGFDSDNDDPRSVAQAVGAALVATGPFCPQCAVAGGVVTGIAALIPDNRDDYMGDMQIHFTDNTNRWNTTAPPAAGDPGYLGRRYDFPNGSLRVWVRAEEWPLVWREPPVIR
ncbi:MAG: hypothetical protein KF901_02345 [Myxococcales bacterium]|nr:hypothetical protein [Myxococcales bacterium]